MGILVRSTLRTIDAGDVHELIRQASEADAGFELRHRSAKSVVLTEAGPAFLLEARGILNQARRFVHMARCTSAVEIRRLSLAFATLSRRSPDVTLLMHRVESEDQCSLIRGVS